MACLFASPNRTYTCFSVCGINNYLCLQLILMNFMRRRLTKQLFWKVLDYQGMDFSWIYQMCLSFKKIFSVIEISLSSRLEKRRQRKQNNRKKKIIFYIKGGLSKLCQKAFQENGCEFTAWISLTLSITFQWMIDCSIQDVCFLYAPIFDT